MTPPLKSLEEEFRLLTNSWKHNTAAQSMLERIVRHPAYQQIIALGPDVVPLILAELQRQPDHWFWALKSITGEDPVPPGANFTEAVEAWLAWGRKRGLI